MAALFELMDGTVAAAICFPSAWVPDRWAKTGAWYMVVWNLYTPQVTERSRPRCRRSAHLRRQSCRLPHRQRLAALQRGRMRSTSELDGLPEVADVADTIRRHRP